MIYFLLFIEFFKIGLFTFGGGYAMIPLVKETVLAHGWLEEEAFYDFLGICESTPGPVALNMATYVGTTQGGFLGAILASLGVVLPSFIIILLVASILKKFIKNKYVNAFFKGVTPVVVGLIFMTGLVLVLKCLGYESIESFSFSLPSLLSFIAILVFYYGYKLIFKKKINNVFLIIFSAGIGILLGIIL